MAHLEKVGARYYAREAPYAVKDALKSAGCHWDADERCWWVGAKNAPKVQAVLDGNAPTQSPAAVEAKSESLDDVRLVAKVKYKGRTYYASFFGPTKTGEKKGRLWSLDGKNFWADANECELLKTYSPKERRTGFGRGPMTTVYTTLGSIRRFIEQQKNPDTARGECVECGSWGPSGQPCQDCGGEGHHQ